ncbi:MAG: hypothetical protein J0L52_09360 [Caulobacterales bacterium]|nr:hypothetical protein [Caulobacterales bacterium]
MADDGENLGSAGPVWERRGRRSSSNPFVGLIVTLLALFGALTVGLSIAERSVGAAGDRIDGWISSGWGMVTGATAGDAVEAAGEAAEAAGDAAESAGDAAEAAADEVARSTDGQ